MLRSTAFALLLVPVLLAGACGNASRDRPAIVKTFPYEGQHLENIVEAVKITYDDRVRLLNPNNVYALDTRGEIGVYAAVDPTDPYSILVRPIAGQTFLPGTTRVIIGSGLVVNGEGQYRLTDFNLFFFLGEGSNLFVASRGLSAVAEIDPQTFEGVHVTPTPGGRTPVAVAGTQVGNVQRVWVQLQNGGGSGHALAYFTPGDANMTEVPLTYEAGGDLVSVAPTLRVSLLGNYILAAFRDEALGRVRAVKVDIRTGVELDTVVLSPPASPATAPLGLRPSPALGFLNVACTSPAGDTLNSVLVTSFVERDLGGGPGVDGLFLPNGAGQLTTWGTTVYIAPAAKTTAHFTAATPLDRGVRESESEVPGKPRDVLITFDGYWLIETLADFDAEDGLVARTRLVVATPEPVTVSTDTGAGNPMPTVFRALVHYRTAARFLVLTDSDALATFRWNVAEIVQDDLDPTLEGVQAADVSAVAPDPLGAAFLTGIYPP